MPTGDTEVRASIEVNGEGWAVTWGPDNCAAYMASQLAHEAKRAAERALAKSAEVR